jgi:hypothetical protein
MKNKEELINSVGKELTELTDKIKSLKDFINSDLFEEIEDMHQELLVMQYESMLDYQSCLIARIKNLEKGN